VLVMGTVGVVWRVLFVVGLSIVGGFGGVRDAGSGRGEDFDVLAPVDFDGCWVGLGPFPWSRGECCAGLLDYSGHQGLGGFRRRGDCECPCPLRLR
jgi:hypothetical protein